MDEDNKISYFCLGMGLGVAVGMLFAPKSGPETREFLVGKADEGKQYLKRRGGDLKDSAGDLIDRGRDVVGRQKDILNASVEAGKQAYREAVASDGRSLSGEGHLPV